MPSNLPLWGLFWGLVSAVSLPAGALLGLRFRPPKKVTSALMAFGGGALLFALTLELFGHVLHVAADAHGHITQHSLVVVTMIAAAIGGLLFQGLDHALNNRGGFLRKRSLLAKHVSKRKRKEANRLLACLSRVEALHELPPEEVVRLVSRAVRTDFAAGDVIFEEGAEGDRLYFVVAGEVEVTRGGTADKPQQFIATLGPGDVFGEVALVSGAPRSATVTAKTDIKVIEILKEDFDEILAEAPALGNSLGNLARERIADLSHHDEISDEEQDRWQERVSRRLDPQLLRMTPDDARVEASEHVRGTSAAMAIWLGIALDGIPESLVIGMLVVKAAASGASMSFAFIVGVFLANLPEAMSSSVTMSNGGLSGAKIMWMWTSLCLMTGLGALLGTLMLPAHPTGNALYFVFGIEGLAAGAMLTMIAETMLPEAFEQGSGPIVGLSTLSGFLAALGVKLI